jgi:hypothetical protein
VAGDLPAAVDPFRPGRRQQEGEVVAGLAVARGQHLAGRGGPQDPLAAGRAHALQVGGEADPVEVHVDAQRGGGGVVGQAALQPVDLGEVQARPAELGG